MEDYYPVAQRQSGPQRPHNAASGLLIPDPSEPSHRGSRHGVSDTQDYIFGQRLAAKWQRLVAFGVDFIVAIMVPLWLAEPLLGPDGLAGVSAANYAVMSAVTVALLFGGWSGDSGWGNFRSPGKCLVGIQAVRPVRISGPVAKGEREVNVAPGRVRGGARVVLHLVDVTLGAGLVFLLFNTYNRTIADAWTHTIHVRVDNYFGASPPPPAPPGSVDAT